MSFRRDTIPQEPEGKAYARVSRMSRFKWKIDIFLPDEYGWPSEVWNYLGTRRGAERTAEKCLKKALRIRNYRREPVTIFKEQQQ